MPKGGAVLMYCSRSGFTTPSRARPASASKAHSAAVVFGPNLPSTGPGSNLRAFSRSCSARVLGPLLPAWRLPTSMAGAVVVVVVLAVVDVVVEDVERGVAVVVDRWVDGVVALVGPASAPPPALHAPRSTTATSSAVPAVTLPFPHVTAPVWRSRDVAPRHPPHEGGRERYPTRPTGGGRRPSWRSSVAKPTPQDDEAPQDDRADEDLLATARRGDDAAFARLLEEHDPVLRRMVGVLVDHRDTERVLREGYVKAYRALGRAHGDPVAWLGRACYLTALDEVRRRDRRRTGGPGRKPSTEPPPGPAGRLPPDQRAALVLDGLVPPETAAAILATSSSTV